MAVPNQKNVLINRTHAKQTKFFIIDQEQYFSAANRLTLSGMKVYMYLQMQVPDTWNEQKNKDNLRNKPFELSPQDISNKTQMNAKSAQRGIEDLISNGYLKLINDKLNLYQYIDILPEDRGQTYEEYEQVQDYVELLQNSINNLHQTRQEQLYEIAKRQAQKTNKY